MVRQLVLIISFAVAAASVGCAPEEDKPPSVEIGGNGPPTGRQGTDEYPEGPYGRGNPEVGDVVEDLQFLGYLGAQGKDIDTSRSTVETSFSDIRQRGASYLLVHISSFWCATCQPEAYYMSRFKEQIMEAGGDALEIIIEGTTAQLDPTPAQLDVWVDNLDLEMTTVIPNDDNARKVFPDRDFVYIIDLETMEVVWREEGPSDEPTTTEIGALEMLSVWLGE